MIHPGRLSKKVWTSSLVIVAGNLVSLFFVTFLDSLKKIAVVYSASILFIVRSRLDSVVSPTNFGSDLNLRSSQFVGRIS